MAPIETNSLKLVRTCHKCASVIEQQARFCGECGSSSSHGSANEFEAVSNSSSGIAFAGHPLQYVRPQSQHFGFEPNLHAGQHPATPNFAHMPDQHIDPRLRDELAHLIVLLARERLFLYMHWLIYLSVTALGFWLGMKCYTEFNGDDLSKLSIALAPIVLINSAALVSLWPIKGTKREIARLKERITYLRFQIEYQNVI